MYEIQAISMCGGLNLPKIEVIVKWEDRKAMNALHKKVGGSFPLGDKDRMTLIER